LICPNCHLLQLIPFNSKSIIMKNISPINTRINKCFDPGIFKFFLIFLLTMLFAFSGCELFKEEEEEPTAPPPVPVNVEVYQLDWYDDDGNLIMANSLWGYIRWTYLPDRTKTYYLNLALLKKDNTNTAWIIQNLPLFAVTNTDITEINEGAYFNIGDMDVLAGENLVETAYGLTVTDYVVSAGPYPTNNSVMVDVLKWYPTNSPDECPIPDPFEGPGTPNNIQISFPAFEVIGLREIKWVQEARAKCCAGAMARSIDWLNRKHKLGMTKSAQQIYHDLIGADVSKPNDDSTTARDEWIERKNNYCNEMTNNKIETKIWESSPNQVDSTEGVSQVTGDFIEWFLSEINSGEDVEIAYYYPENSHIVTVGQVFKSNGELYVKYRDDEWQGDNMRGDRDLKPAKIYLKDGKYRFGSDRNIIYFAVSESVKED